MVDVAEKYLTKYLNLGLPSTNRRGVHGPEAPDRRQRGISGTSRRGLRMERDSVGIRKMGWNVLMHVDSTTLLMYTSELVQVESKEAPRNARTKYALSYALGSLILKRQYRRRAPQSV